MKNHAKVGSRPGKPAYRTPASFVNKFVNKKALQSLKIKIFNHISNLYRRPKTA